MPPQRPAMNRIAPARMSRIQKTGSRIEFKRLRTDRVSRQSWVAGTSVATEWVRAAGAGTARFREALPLLPDWLPPISEAMSNELISHGLLRFYFTIIGRNTYKEMGISGYGLPKAAGNSLFSRSLALRNLLL